MKEGLEPGGSEPEGQQRCTAVPSPALGAGGGLCVSLSNHFLFQAAPPRVPFLPEAGAFRRLLTTLRCLSTEPARPAVVVLTCLAFHVSSRWLCKERFM